MSTRPARSTSTARSSAARLVRSIVACVRNHNAVTSATDSPMAMRTIRVKIEPRSRMDLSPVEQPVARAPDRLECRPVEAFLQLSPQPAHVHIDDVRLGIEVHLPDVA